MYKFRKQRNLVVNLTIKEKKKFLNSLSVENDSNLFWETCKPYFSNKGIKTSGNIIRSDKEGLILKEIEVVPEFNIHFQSITSSLGLFKWPDSSESLNESDPIKSIVNKYKNHPSIKKINSKYITVKSFSFRPVTPKDVLDVISTLDDTKSSGGDIPLRILKGNKIVSQVLCKWINNSLKTGTFPDPLKLAEIIPIHKREYPFDKDHYLPINILLLISKVFEKIIYSQVNSNIQQYLNPLLCGFRQGHGTQRAFFRLLQAWQKELDESGYAEKVLMDLLKTYDCLPHDLMWPKNDNPEKTEAATKSCRTLPDVCFQKKMCEIDFVPKSCTYKTSFFFQKLAIHEFFFCSKYFL